MLEASIARFFGARARNPIRPVTAPTPPLRRNFQHPASGKQRFNDGRLLSRREGGRQIAGGLPATNNTVRLDWEILRHHDVYMRTTLTLDPDVEKLIREEVHRQRRSFKEVVNDALRRGLTNPGNASAREKFRVRPHHTTLRPGIDPGALNRLAGELEDEAIVEKLRDRR